MGKFISGINEIAGKSAKAAEDRLTQFIKEQEEAELEAHRDEPDMLTVIS